MCQLKTLYLNPFLCLTQSYGGRKFLSILFYIPQKFYNHTWGQVSGSKNTYLINSNVHPLTPLCISELINDWWKIFIPKRNLHHYLPQYFRVIKYSSPIFICPTDNFQQHSRTSISINKLWPNKFQSTITQYYINNSKIGCWSQNHRFIPDGVLILNTSNNDIKQHQFFSSFKK